MSANIKVYIMVSFGSRIGQSLVMVTLQTPFVGAANGLLGYIYSKLADLPPTETAKAWAVWFVAENAFTGLAVAFSEDLSTKKFIKASCILLGGILGISELEKRGLIGHKMTIFIAVMRALAILKTFAVNPPDPVTKSHI